VLIDVAEERVGTSCFFLISLVLLGASFEALGEGRPAAPSADGKCPVAADTQRWTKQEIFVWDRVCSGAIADFNEGTAYGGNLDPNGPEGLPESRILSSRFLETILLEDKYRSALPHRGVRIIGARFKERIDLVNAELKHELWLNRCLLEQGVDFSGAKSSNLLSFDGSKVTGEFTMNGSRIDDSVFMPDARFADVAMGGTRIGRTLEFDGSTVTGTLNMEMLHVNSFLFMRDGQFREVMLRNGRVGGTLEFDGSTVTGTLNMEMLHVDKPLFMRNGQFGEVVLRDAHIGALELDGSKVSRTLNMEKLRVDSSVFMRHGQFSDVVLRNDRLGGPLEFDGATVTGTLNMNMLNVDSSLFMRDGQFGEVVLRDAHIGALELDGSRVSRTLDMGKLRVDSSVYMRHGQFGEVVLRSARISGTLELDGSKVSRTLNMDKLRVDSSLFLRNDAKFADVNLTSTRVGGQLNLVHAKVGGNLQCYSLVVDEDGLLYDAQFSGRIDCQFAKFRSLYLDNSTFGGDVDLSSAQLSGELALGEAVPQHSPQWSPGKTLILRNARAETIPILTDAWPAQVDVNGFTYKALRRDIAVDHHRTPECPSDLFRCWFGKQQSFSPHAYEQLALAFQNQGHADDARAIRYDGREREVSESGGLRYAWLTTLNWAIGYGHHIELAMIWTFLLVILGAFVLAVSGEGPKNGMPVGLSYSFDMLLPIIKLRDAHYEIDLVGWPRYYFYVHKIAGYVLATFLIAGISGLTK